MASQPAASLPRIAIRSWGLETLLLGDSKLVWYLLFSAWGLIFVATITGNGHWLHGDPLAEHPSWTLGMNLLTFLAAWLVMTIAMMLPASLPLLQLFAEVSRRQKLRHRESLLLLFITAYLTIWSIFALITFLGDLGWHRLLDSQSWLTQNSSWFAAIVRLLAGAFQFSPLKEQCLRVCRHPFGFLTQHYRRGIRATWNLGIRHGLSCLGCCWALMLIMFSVGVTHLAGMLVLSAVMVIEKTVTWGRTLVPLVGVTLLVWGGLTLWSADTGRVILTGSRCSVNQSAAPTSR
jgi:predicted metal-binding membrane protein